MSSKYWESALKTRENLEAGIIFLGQCLLSCNRVGGTFGNFMCQMAQKRQPKQNVGR